MGCHQKLCPVENLGMLEKKVLTSNLGNLSFKSLLTSLDKSVEEHLN
jgi:hypothetical protein